MKTDLTHPTLERIYTSNENIKGILQNLESIMDNNSFSKLYEQYSEIEKRIPRDEVLTEEEKTLGYFGVDIRYTSLANEVSSFSSDLSIYNIYKELSDCIQDVMQDTKNIFRKDMNISIDDYIEKNKKLANMIINTKNDNKIHQFTNLMDKAIEALFSSLKTLSFIGNSDLLTSIEETYSDYLREHLGSKVRKNIDVSKYKGNLSEDYINNSVLYECALQDQEIMVRQKEAQEYEEKQNFLESERRSQIDYLKNSLDDFSKNIEKYKETLLKLQLNRNIIKAKKILFNLSLAPVIAIPLSCPFLGNKLGKHLSSQIQLTKTYTNTVDMDSGEVISSSESYEELNTNYVASITICDPWKKNLSGSSYSRNCVVYDYVVPEEDLLNDDFRLTKDTIDYNNLVKKYPYEDSTPSVPNPKYLTEHQIYVTETYQNFNEVVPSTKYNVPYTIGGIGLGLILGTTEGLLYYLWFKECVEKYQRKQEKTSQKIEEDTIDTKRILQLTLEKQKSVQQEYEDLTKPKSY